MTATYPIMNLCARSTGHAGQYGQVANCCKNFTQWNDLLHQAESHGMTPLLFKHITAADCFCPDTVKRSLRLLYLRHRRINHVLVKELRDILSRLEKEGIQVLVMKGAALCHTVYPDISLRPMRDIDILARKEDAQRTQDILMSSGFTASNAPIPQDHFHLPSLHKTIQQQPVCIEIHRGLFPSCPPYYSPMLFDDLIKTALTFDLDGLTAYTFGNEEMLWYLYQHGFHAPLTYEQYKTINAADIISLVEEKLEDIDWEKVRNLYPVLFNILPLFHYLTPWQNKVVDIFNIDTLPLPDGIGKPFQGWPQLRLKEQKEKGLVKILYDTFFPPEWWFKIYYGIPDWKSYWWHRIVRHPIHVFWWIRLYAPYLNESNPPASEGKGPVVKPSGNFSALCHIKNSLTALLRKFR